MIEPCTNQVVGNILAGWRYDISGLNPEMSGDYEQHFAECGHCRSRRKLHRILDVSLILMASVFGVVFLLAFGVIRYFNPHYAIWFELAALVGFGLSALLWLAVALATPAPMTLADAAKIGARHVHDRLPAEIRERLPEELVVKIIGQGTNPEPSSDI